MKKKVIPMLLAAVICAGSLLFTPVRAEAAVNGGTVQAHTNEGTVIQNGDQIYYAGGDAIYCIPADGGNSTPVVSLSDLGVAYGGFAFLNVDGGQLIFYVWSDKFAPGSYGIYRHDLATGQNVRLLQAADVLAMTVKDEWITYAVSPGADASYCLPAYSKSLQSPMNGGSKLSTVALRRIGIDGTGDQALGAAFPGWANSFLLTEDWVYYVDMVAKKSEDEYAFPLCRIKPDGTDQAVVCGEMVDCRSLGITFTDGWLYFEASSQGFALCRVRPDGTGFARVAENAPGTMVESDGILYCGESDFQNQHKDENDNSYAEQVIYRLSGGSRAEIFRISDKNWTGLYNMQAVNGWIYFSVRHPHENIFWGDYEHQPRNFSYEIYRMKPDGTGVKLLSTGNPEDGMYYWDDGSCTPDSEVTMVDLIM